MLLVLVLGGVATLAWGYLAYGRLAERWLGVDPARTTPAVAVNDGLDYCPAKGLVLFGHHFSSIAGAGPIVGPILAAALFGWLPAYVWIILGAIFVGGIHDFSALVASVRHQGRSIAEVGREYLGEFPFRLFLVFIWLTLVYVLIVFLDLTRGTFAALAAGPGEVAGGSVATASCLYILLAVVFGLLTFKKVLSLPRLTAIFVPLVFVAIYLGYLAPLNLAGDLAAGKALWGYLLLGYCLVASVLPVWLLLQPRDYLSSFLLFACLLAGGLGLVVAGLGGQVPIQLDLFHARHPVQGFFLPAVFIIVACGACSGFHAMVSSGTSAKQLASESQAKPIGYGGMLVEGVLALIALAAIMAAGPVLTGGKLDPVATFANGVAVFLGALGLPQAAGELFGRLAVSTFLLTTLDTATRIGRYVFEEFFGISRYPWARFISTPATLLLPLYFVIYPMIGGQPAWRAIWPVFGATNQLLAAMALLVVTVWLARTGRRWLFTGLPMLFMLVVTATALAMLVFNLGFGLVGTIAAVLLAMAAVLTVVALRALFTRPPAPPPPETNPETGGTS